MKNITKNISWIGVDNPKGRDFHGIPTSRGGSYNSYLILDEHPTIIDTTNTPFFNEWKKSLTEQIDPKKIEHIVINHAEPDHTGALKEITQLCPNATIVCTEKCKEFLQSMYGLKCEFKTIKDQETLSLGHHTLQFLVTPMVHWPETMMTYEQETKTLFSSDLFGTEVSHEALFADEMESFEKLTRDYFAIVMRPLAFSAKTAIEKAKQLKISFLAPSHGPVYRKNPRNIIDYYEKLCTDPEEDKVTIIYSSIWHGTERITDQIKAQLESKSIPCNLFNVNSSNMVELMAECLTSKVVCPGSLTILGGYHPIFETLFTFLKVNNQKGKHVVTFGTHGWSSASVPKLNKKCEELGYNILDSIDSRFGKPPEISETIKKIQEALQNAN